MMCFPVLVTSEDEGNLETLSVNLLLLPNKKCLSSLTSLPPPSRILTVIYLYYAIPKKHSTYKSDYLLNITNPNTKIYIIIY